MTGFVTAASVAVIAVLAALRMRLESNRMRRKLEVRFLHRRETLAFLNSAFDRMGVKVLDVAFYVESREDSNVYSNVYTLSLRRQSDYDELLRVLSTHPHILTVQEKKA